MSDWQFRKSAPSDNVMVPATADPFESPKWAPPIWHMPEGLVLLVNLVRGLVRVVLFAIRHPFPIALALGLGSIAYTAGWSALVWLGASVALALGGWAVLDRASFLRLVARPLRARWRHVRHLPAALAPVMVMSGLAFYRNHREYLPTLIRVTVTPTTDRLLVKMLSGQAPIIWEEHAENLAHGFGARVCRVRTAGQAGVRVAGVRPRRCPRRAHPGACPSPRRWTWNGCRSGGARTAGRSCCGCSARTSCSPAPTGAGKGSFFWSAIRALLPAVKAGFVQLWALDPKRMELAFGRRLFDRYSDDPDGGMVALLEDAVAEMQDRAARFGGWTRTFIPSPVDPLIVVVHR